MKPPQTKKKTTVVRVLSPRRRWAFRLTALLLPLALVAALEIGLRLAGVGYDPHFFKHLTISGEDYIVQNDDFSRQFFPAEIARTATPLRMPAHKAPGTFRIFILGESAAMGDPEPAYGAGRYLEMLLRDRYPGTPFEIINVAFTAINSHVIVPIARECAQHEGDLWIVYMGNNEMVGPFGAATVFGKRAPPLPYVRLVTALRRTRTGQLLTEWVRRESQGKKATAWRGMQMFLQNEIAPDSPMKETVYRNFAKNLDDIVRAGTRSGAKVLLNTVAVNLRDCAPFASLGSSNLSATDRGQFAAWLAAGEQEAAKNHPAAAAALLAQAATLQPQSAEVQFAWGRCLLTETNLAASREHLQAACDDDTMPFRTDSRLNTLIRQESDRVPGNNLILLDAAQALAAENPDGLCGQETFYEHVHFDFDGSYRLARLWAEQVAPLLPPSSRAWAAQSAIEDMLGLSDWNRALVLEHMAGRMEIPPFNAQPGNDRRRENLQARATRLHGRMDAADAAQARAHFLKQLTDAPDDFELRENYALFLQATGDLAGSCAEWRRIHDLIPQDYLAYFQMGRMLVTLGQKEEAERCLRQAVSIRPGLTEGWIQLGNLMASQERFSEALSDFTTALHQLPEDGDTHFRSAKVLAKLNRHPEAVQQYREAIRCRPDGWEAHYELGGELDAAGQLDGAREEFGAAARLNPNDAQTHFNYGVLLAKQNRLDEAQHEFEETLRLSPDYPNARQYIAQLGILRQRAP